MKTTVQIIKGYLFQKKRKHGKRVEPNNLLLFTKKYRSGKSMLHYISNTRSDIAKYVQYNLHKSIHILHRDGIHLF